MRGAGVLLTKISMDAFGQVLRGAFTDLDNFLSRLRIECGASGEAHKSDVLLMQLAAMCVFVAWKIDHTLPDHRTGCVQTC